MKKITRILMLFLAISAFAVSKNYAQEIVVGARLYHHPREVRPMRPSRAHIWVGGEWTPNGGTYAWHAGYWALPPHAHAIWIKGHWRHHHRGWVWIKGRWSR